MTDADVGQQTGGKSSKIAEVQSTRTIIYS